MSQRSKLYPVGLVRGTRLVLYILGLWVVWVLGYQMGWEDSVRDTGERPPYSRLAQVLRS